MASEEDDIPILSQSAVSFDRMSIDELEEYVDDLKNEIIKTEDIIRKKKIAQSAANNVFGN